MFSMYVEGKCPKCGQEFNFAWDDRKNVIWEEPVIEGKKSIKISVICSNCEEKFSRTYVGVREIPFES